MLQAELHQLSFEERQNDSIIAQLGISADGDEVASTRREQETIFLFLFAIVKLSIVKKRIFRRPSINYHKEQTMNILQKVLGLLTKKSMHCELQLLYPHVTAISIDY